MRQKKLPYMHPISWVDSALKIGHIATAMLPLFMTESTS